MTWCRKSQNSSNMPYKSLALGPDDLWFHTESTNSKKEKFSNFKIVYKENPARVLLTLCPFRAFWPLFAFVLPWCLLIDVGLCHYEIMNAT